jgi:hypothetical protein
MEFLIISKSLIMANTYFSLIEHIITKLHNKFHNFSMSQELVMNFQSSAHILKKKKKNDTAHHYSLES